MNKVFKLAIGELKKIFMRPTIFVMIALLLLTSLVCMLTFTPDKNNKDMITIKEKTIESIYANYSSIDSPYSKLEMDKIVQETYDDYIGFTSENTLTSLKGDITGSYQLFNDLKDLISNAGNSSGDFDWNKANEKILAYKNSLTKISVVLRDIMDDKSFLIVNSDFDKAIKLVDSHSGHITIYNSQQTVETYKILKQVLVADEFNEKITNYISTIIKIENLANIKTTLQNDYYQVGINSLANIDSKIQEFYANAIENADKVDEFKTLIQNYYSRVQTVALNIVTGYKYLIATNISDTQMDSFQGYAGYNSTNISSTLAINTYLIENDLYAYNYSDALTFGKTSNAETSTFDYLNYALDILTVLIIVFCVIICSKMIAGEQSNNTIKLLAIRPLSRNKILFGKLLATILFAMIFTTFSLIVNFIIGICFFNFNVTLMIGVVASKVFITSPIVFIILQLISISIKLMVYISLCLMISVLFKSYTGASISSFILYFATVLLNAVAGTNAWYRFLPMSHFDLYKYFTGTQTSTGLSIVFSSPILPSTNLWFSLIYVGVLIIVLNLVSFAVFNNKDIA